MGAVGVPASRDIEWDLMSLLQVAMLNGRWWASCESVRCIDRLRDVHRPRARTSTDSLNADVYVFDGPADRAAQPSLANRRLRATISARSYRSGRRSARPGQDDTPSRRL